MKRTNGMYSSGRSWIRSLCPAMALLAGLATTVAYAQLSAERFRARVDVSGLRWQRLDPDQILPLLKMLAAQAQGNYERIRTWRGLYHVRHRDWRSAAQAASLGAPPRPLEQRTEYDLEFAIDLASDAIFRYKKNSKTEWVDPSTQSPVQVAGTVCDERLVITPDHCVVFSPEERFGEFKAVSGHPQAKMKRAAFRYAVESAKAKLYRAWFDPRHWYGRTSRRKFWDMLRICIGGFQGEYGADVANKLCEQTHMYKAARGEGLWYRKDDVNQAPDRTNAYNRMLWASEDGFHPVSWDVRKGGFDGEPIQARYWRFERRDGIYVPVWMAEEFYTLGGGDLQRTTEAELLDCVLNEPIDPSQFSYAGLGLRTGDLVMDHIEGVCYIMKDGELEKLADFGERYVPPEERAERRMLRWVLAAIGVTGLAVLGILLARRRRSRSADSAARSGKR